MTVHIHPSIDNGVKKGSGSFSGGTLVCKCKDRPVKVGIKGDVAHNHACGCTKCWKPDGAVFAVIAVVPRENVTVLENGDKLQIVDTSATIQRKASAGPRLKRRCPPSSGRSSASPRRTWSSSPPISCLRPPAQPRSPAWPGAA